MQRSLFNRIGLIHYCGTLVLNCWSYPQIFIKALKSNKILTSNVLVSKYRRKHDQISL